VLFDCASPEYRYILHGSPDRELSLEISDKSDGPIGVSTWRGRWTDMRTGYVTGQQGGHQRHLRLSDRAGHFILYEGENGELAEVPGQTYAGVSLLEGAGEGEPVNLASCEASAANRSVVQSVRDLRARAGLPELPEEEPDGPFDAWF
jgi:hypothetical protein